MKKSIYTIIVLSTLMNTFVFSKEIIITKIIKNKENLIWEQGFQIKSNEKNWANAKKYCQNLTLNNSNTWRLPTFDELKSYKKDVNIVKDDYYWSSTSNIKDKGEVYIFDISNQLSCEGVIESDKYYVLCVTEN